MRRFLISHIRAKSIVIENVGDKLSISLVYGDVVKITPWTFSTSQYINFFDQRQERYELWQIDDCVCKPKKIRVLEKNFKGLQYSIDQLKRISSIIDVKLTLDIFSEYFHRSFSNYDNIIFNNSSRKKFDDDTNLMFSGDTLAIVYKGNYYNLILDRKAERLGDSFIKGKI